MCTIVRNSRVFNHCLGLTTKHAGNRSIYRIRLSICVIKQSIFFSYRQPWISINAFIVQFFRTGSVVQTESCRSRHSDTITKQSKGRGILPLIADISISSYCGHHTGIQIPNQIHQISISDIFPIKKEHYQQKGH